MTFELVDMKRDWLAGFDDDIVVTSLVRCEEALILYQMTYISAGALVSSAKLAQTSSPFKGMRLENWIVPSLQSNRRCSQSMNDTSSNNDRVCFSRSEGGQNFGCIVKCFRHWTEKRLCKVLFCCKHKIQRG